MSIVDPECYPRGHDDDRLVCAGCFEDDDLIAMIVDSEIDGDCEFCGAEAVPVVELGELVQHIETRMGCFYGRAVDQLPYESREGGYLGETFDAIELLFGEIGLELPRDDAGSLRDAICDLLEDDAWCAYDWTALDPDESLIYGWERFCEITKHDRRFFFQHAGQMPWDGIDDRTPIALLRDVADVLREQGLIVRRKPGMRFYRARPRAEDEHHETPAALGPPPAKLALQSNRMNPPGIPMFYGAKSAELARAEVRSALASIGTFRTTRAVTLLDLADLPAVPGFFSHAGREDRLHLSFLHDFARAVSLPVPRDERTHIDYVPTQVFTEFLRDFRFGDGVRIDGIRYPSAAGEGVNLVLFATQDDLVGGAAERIYPEPTPWIELIEVTHV